MTLSTKFPIIDESVFLGGAGGLWPQARAADFARAVAEDISSVDARNARIAGVKLPFHTYIDGTETHDLHLVKTTSRIVARWELAVAAVSYVWDRVREDGPYDNGDYRRSARIYADRREVRDPAATAGAREVLILPLVPYARKIERGFKGYAPGHVYEAIAQAAAARFGNAARIRFTYAEPEGSAPELQSWASLRARRRGSKRSEHRRDLRQPAILILMDRL